jgi:hypothetical protein
MVKFNERVAEMGALKPPGSPLDFLRAPILIILALLFAVSLYWVVEPTSAPAPISRFIQTTIYHHPPTPKGGKHK